VAAKGELFELQIARLLVAEGAFVRRRVNLEPSGRQVTDLDVLAFLFDETLRLRLATGECKTAEAKSAPSSKDRLLWLAGVNQLVGADDGFLATMRNARDEDREVARSLNLEIIEPRALERRERIALPEAMTAHSEAALAIERQVDTACGKDDELKRVYQFVRSELWLAPPVAALKRALGAMRILGSRWSPSLGEAQQVVLRWLFAELLCGFVIAAVRLAGESYRTPEDVFAKRLNERLAEGLASYDSMREIAKQVDRFMVGVLREAGVGETEVVGAIGALAPRPPAYAEPLLELIQRFAAEPRLARQVPRLAERYAASEYPSEEPEAARLLRLVAAFVERQGRVPADLVTPLRWRSGVDSSSDAGDSTHSAKSGDPSGSGDSKDSADSHDSSHPGESDSTDSRRAPATTVSKNKAVRKSETPEAKAIGDTASASSASVEIPLFRE